MDPDIIGERGETLFRAAITKWCGGVPWFRVAHQGEKTEALDFEVTLLRSSVFHAMLFVQVKATAKMNRYSGTGGQRKLSVRLTRADARKLGRMKVPAYVVGIDVYSGAAFVKHIPAGATTGFRGISVRRRLNCRAIQRIWQEVESFWNARPQGMTSSGF